MAWHADALRTLRESGLFTEVNLTGAKIRAALDASRFVDIHFDPDTRSYSYALIDLTLPYPGDKRVFGWDDFPHPGQPQLQELDSHPHHFQERGPNGEWIFRASAFRGEIETEVDGVLRHLRAYLKAHASAE